jgi:hypothetical protein
MIEMVIDPDLPGRERYVAIYARDEAIDQRGQQNKLATTQTDINQ